MNGEMRPDHVGPFQLFISTYTDVKFTLCQPWFRTREYSCTKQIKFCLYAVYILVGGDS